MLTKNERRLQNLCLLTAKMFAPFDTGLLRLRAIRSTAMPNGFTIHWDGGIAPYLGFVDTGKSGNEHNRGFIRASKDAILEHVADYGAHPNNFSSSRASSLAKQTEGMVDRFRPFRRYSDAMNEEELTQIEKDRLNQHHMYLQKKYKLADFDFNSRNRR